MSAALAEKLAEIAEAHATLGALYMEVSALYDADSAKSGKSNNDAPAGKVSGSKGKAGVASKAKPVEDAGEDDDDLPPAKPAGTKGKPAVKARPKAAAVTEDDVRAAAQALIKAKGRQAALDVLGEYSAGKIADLEEGQYAEVKEALEAATADEDDDGI